MYPSSRFGNLCIRSECRDASPPCLLYVPPSLQGGARSGRLLTAPRARFSVSRRFTAQKFPDSLRTQRETHLGELYGDETSGTAFKICATIVRRVNVLPNSFIMIIATAVNLTHRGRTSLLVSHRGHSRPLTAPPQSVHAGRSTSPRAGAC